MTLYQHANKHLHDYPSDDEVILPEVSIGSQALLAVDEAALLRLTDAIGDTQSQVGLDEGEKKFNKVGFKRSRKLR